MACDGVWDVFTDQSAVAFVTRALTEKVREFDGDKGLDTFEEVSKQPFSVKYSLWPLKYGFPAVLRRCFEAR